VEFAALTSKFSKAYSTEDCSITLLRGTAQYPLCVKNRQAAGACFCPKRTNEHPRAPERIGAALACGRRRPVRCLPSRRGAAAALV